MSDVASINRYRKKSTLLYALKASKISQFFFIRIHQIKYCKLTKMFLLKGFANKMDRINRVFKKGGRYELASRRDDLQ